MTTQVMLDLETLGTKPGSVIVAIGAVKFRDGEILSEYYERIDPRSCVDAGLKVDVGTVMWWMRQDNAARLEIAKGGEPLKDVLEAFDNWIVNPEVEVWGNGVGFDNALLSAAYDAVKMDCPWEFYNDRCYRTLKNLYPQVGITRSGTHHNALDDARDQAIHLMKILDLIYGTKK